MDDFASDNTTARLSTLEGRMTALEVDYWGPDKTNGRRSQIVAIENRVDDLEDDQRKLKGDLRHYLDREREETCVGRRLLAEHEADHDAKIEEGTQVAVAQIQAGAMKGSAKWQGIAIIIGQVLTLAGIVVVAVIK